jgi:hypothetical protein
MASSLYSEANVGIHNDKSPTMPEMALHLRLNPLHSITGVLVFLLSQT